MKNSPNSDDASLLWVGAEAAVRDRIADALGSNWSLTTVDVFPSAETPADGTVSAGEVKPVTASTTGEQTDGDSDIIPAIRAATPNAVVIAGVPTGDGWETMMDRMLRDTAAPRFCFAADASAGEIDRALESGVDGVFLGSECRGIERLIRAIERSVETSGDQQRSSEQSPGDEGSSIIPADGATVLPNGEASTAGTIATVLPGTVFRKVPADGWPVTTISHGVDDLTGYPVERYLEGEIDWLTDVVYEPDVERVRGVVEDAIELAEAYEMTYRIVANGAEGPTPVREYGHVVSDGDEIVALEGFVVDITEERERTERLSTQRDRISALHRSAVDLESCETPQDVYDLLIETAVDVLDFDYCSVSEASDGVLTVVGRSSEGFERSSEDDPSSVPVGEGLSGRAFAERRPIVTPDLTVAETAQEPERFQSALTVPIGQYGVLQGSSTHKSEFDRNDLRLTQVLVNHAVMALDGISREGALRERERELREQNERLEEFASVLSHDLRNPLTVARGWTEMLEDDVEDPGEAIERIKGAHDRMDAIIEDVLTLARNGEPVTEPETVALRSAATTAWETCSTADASLSVRTERTVQADPTRLRRLLENLFSNAVRHGGTTVSVLVGDSNRGFYVADDGPGIPESEREKVFRSGVSGHEDGTGFGLAIVATIAEAHGWTVTVSESDQGGAQFDIVVNPA